MCVCVCDCFMRACGYVYVCASVCQSVCMSVIILSSKWEFINYYFSAGHLFRYHNDLSY